VTEQPRELLARAGYVVVSVPEGHICCGSAGTYNILQPDIAEVLGRRKADQLASTHADIAAMGNIGCLTQLRRHSEIPTVHTAELLDWATGGPMPPRLVGKNLRDPGPATGETGRSATSNPDTPTGFW
jgi:glycolate oxidase iron-sulfur subunit